MTGILHCVSSYSRAASRGKEGGGRLQIADCRLLKIEDFRLKTMWTQGYMIQIADDAVGLLI
jgi:hypothetical protein